MSVYTKLTSIQASLKVGKTRIPRDKNGKPGKYTFRNKEDIQEALKPLLIEHQAACWVTDEIKTYEGHVYVDSTAFFVDLEDDKSTVITAHGVSREQMNPSFMSVEQSTGSAASYSGKRALGNLFNLSDEEDSDTTGNQEPPKGDFVAKCKTCGKAYTFKNVEQMKNMKCCAKPDYEVVR